MNFILFYAWISGLSTIAKILCTFFFFRNKVQMCKFNKFKENVNHGPQFLTWGI